MNFVFFQNKQVGFIEGDTYYSHRTREHIFYKYENGFGLSVKLIDVLEQEDIKKVCIIFENYHKLFCPISFFYIKGFPYSDGDDEQLILPNKFFNKEISKENQEVLA